MDYKEHILNEVKSVMGGHAKSFEISIPDDKNILADDHWDFCALVEFKPKQDECYEFEIKDWTGCIPMFIEKSDPTKEVFIQDSEGEEMQLTREHIYGFLFWESISVDD